MLFSRGNKGAEAAVEAEKPCRSNSSTPVKKRSIWRRKSTGDVVQDYNNDNNNNNNTSTSSEYFTYNDEPTVQPKREYTRQVSIERTVHVVVQDEDYYVDHSIFQRLQALPHHCLENKDSQDRFVYVIGSDHLRTMHMTKDQFEAVLHHMIFHSIPNTISPNTNESTRRKLVTNKTRKTWNQQVWQEMCTMLELDSIKDYTRNTNVAPSSHNSNNNDDENVGDNNNVVSGTPSVPTRRSFFGRKNSTTTLDDEDKSSSHNASSSNINDTTDEGRSGSWSQRLFGKRFSSRKITVEGEDIDPNEIQDYENDDYYYNDSNNNSNNNQDNNSYMPQQATEKSENAFMASLSTPRRMMRTLSLTGMNDKQYDGAFDDQADSQPLEVREEQQSEYAPSRPKFWRSMSLTSRQSNDEYVDSFSRKSCKLNAIKNNHQHMPLHLLGHPASDLLD